MKNFRPFFAYFLRILYDSRTFSPLFGKILHFFQQKAEIEAFMGEKTKLRFGEGARSFRFLYKKCYFRRSHPMMG